jgi:ABC-type Zn uptake system ZnuABC Zn-binding protein ZnuA
LVTNHDSFGYFAQAYNFEILGTVVPGSSTIAEPSASDLAALIGTMEEHGVCTIFTETTASDSLSQTVAAELETCDAVQVVALYTEAIGLAGSGAHSYIDMFRANVEAIVTGLK